MPTKVSGWMAQRVLSGLKYVSTLILAARSLVQLLIGKAAYGRRS
jgi:hypothetical protein